MVKGLLNVKKFLAVVAFLALALPALPSLAVSTVTKTVTVKWNTQAISTLALHTDYSATGAFGASAGTILTGNNGGAGTCTATDPTNTDLTVDFGAVTPDAGVAYTNCLYKNAVNAQVVTNSANWSLATQVTSAAAPADTLLCALPNGIATFPTSAAALPVAQTARAAAVAITSMACPAGAVNVSTTSANMVNADTTAFSSASPANVGSDYELVLKPLAAASGGSPTQVTVTYTLTAN